MRFRLIKPTWARKYLKKGIENPEYVREIDGPSTHEGNFDKDFVEGKNKAGYNVYFFPNYPSSLPEDKSTCGGDIDVYQFVFVDMDLKDKIYASKEVFLQKLREFPISPTLVVLSGNGVHAYWEISNLTRETYIELQFKLINYFNTDKSIWTPLQMMRYPGTLNTKDPNNFKLVDVDQETSSGGIYRVEEVRAVLPEMTVEQETKMERSIARIDGTLDEFVSSSVILDELPEKFTKHLAKNKKLSNLFYRPAETGGDRSKADWTLAQELYDLNYNISEALQVIANTKKALSHPDRENYARNTVEKAYRGKAKHVVKSAAERERTGFTKATMGQRIYGPDYFDRTPEGWRRKEVFGLIGAEGIGKSSVTMDIFKHIMLNNDNDDIYLFFSLEMPEAQVIKRWKKMVGPHTELLDRFYVVSKEDDEGNMRRIGLQEIYGYTRDMERLTGKKVAAIAIDHFSIVSPTIDANKHPNFDIGATMETGFGHERNLSSAQLASLLKALAKMLDVFVIVQSQTSKEKGQLGDLPIDGNAAYGISHFDWYCDHVMTIWQPLRRIYTDTELRVLGWQYCKLRESDNSPIKQYEKKLLSFNEDNGEFTNPTQDDMEEFYRLLPIVNKIRDEERKKKVGDSTYSPSLDMKKAMKIIKQYGENDVG